MHGRRVLSATLGLFKRGKCRGASVASVTGTVNITRNLYCHCFPSGRTLFSDTVRRCTSILIRRFMNSRGSDRGALQRVVRSVPTAVRRGSAGCCSIFRKTRGGGFRSRLSLGMYRGLAPLMRGLLLHTQRGNRVRFSSVRTTTVFYICKRLNVLLTSSLARRSGSGEVHRFLVFTLRL